MSNDLKTLVMKFGGSSLQDSERFQKIAAIIAKRLKEYPRIVVVVSAMGNTTDRLVNLGYAVHKSPPRREFDMLLSAGERLSIALLAMALDSIGIPAISFTGSQSGIITTNEHTNAKILDVKPERIFTSLDEGKVVVVAGFQGVSQQKEITTLGRGGSDTTAVALAIKLEADKVEFYKDVKGIYEQDPKIDPNAKVYTSLTYEDALVLANKGGVLHPRSILLAQKNGIFLHLLSFNDCIDEKMDLLGTRVGIGAKRSATVFENEENGLCQN